MDYSHLTLFSTTQAKMRYLGQRQAVIAQNIANVDTPAYQAKDLKPMDFGAMVGGGKLAPVVTNPAHMSGGGAAGSAAAYKQIERKETAETHPNGNNVSLDEEMKNMSLNQSDYAQATALYRKTAQMFKMALGTGNNG